MDDADQSLDDVRDYFKALARSPVAVSAGSGDVTKELAVMSLIQAYRTYGHLLADLDPLKLTPKRSVEIFTLGYHGLTDSDLTETFQASATLGLGNITLAATIQFLETHYTGTVGYEYQHVANLEERSWLMAQIEGVPP